MLYTTTGGPLGMRTLFMGYFGLVGAFIVNLFSIFVLHIPSATFFAIEWWSTWFLLHGVWFALVLLGVGLSTKRN